MDDEQPGREAHLRRIEQALIALDNPAQNVRRATAIIEYGLFGPKKIITCIESIQLSGRIDPETLKTLAKLVSMELKQLPE